MLFPATSGTDGSTWALTTTRSWRASSLTTGRRAARLAARSDHGVALAAGPSWRAAPSTSGGKSSLDEPEDAPVAAAALEGARAGKVVSPPPTAPESFWASRSTRASKSRAVASTVADSEDDDVDLIACRARAKRSASSLWAGGLSGDPPDCEAGDCPDWRGPPARRGEPRKIATPSQQDALSGSAEPSLDALGRPASGCWGAVAEAAGPGAGRPPLICVEAWRRPREAGVRSKARRAQSSQPDGTCGRCGGAEPTRVSVYVFPDQQLLRAEAECLAGGEERGQALQLRLRKAPRRRGRPRPVAPAAQRALPSRFRRSGGVPSAGAFARPSVRPVPPRVQVQHLAPL